MLLMVAMVAPIRSSDAQMMMGMALSVSGALAAGTPAVLLTLFHWAAEGEEEIQYLLGTILSGGLINI